MAKFKHKLKPQQPQQHDELTDYTWPEKISIEECFELVRTGQKKCYCADGRCGCRQCNEVRKQKGEKLCASAEKEGFCDIMQECKKCPNYKPCWIEE